MLIRFIKRIHNAATIPLPQRAIQIIQTTRFKAFFLDYIRNHRLQFPDWNNGVGADFNFIEYRHNPTPPNEFLLDLVSRAVKLLNEEWRANDGFAKLPPALKSIYDYNNHYLLLTALGRVSGAKKIVEVGTASGSSLWAWLRSESTERVDTWDVIPLAKNKSWFPNAEVRQLVERDVDGDTRWTQHVESLIEPGVWQEKSPLFRDADIIWIDGPHDPQLFERQLMDQILTLQNEQPIILLFDDIQLSDMLDFWHGLPIPKLDITSMGHQSGTGLALLPAYRDRTAGR